jgi:hypothetical protein
MVEFLLAALSATTPESSPQISATSISCDLVLPHGSHFRLNGHFDERSLRSNLSDLIQVEGVFVSADRGFIVIEDGVDNHRWRLDSVSDSQIFDASLTEYGSQAAILTVERRRFVGRHWGRSLVGVGLCDIRRGQADE